jgi:hypothetical protein
MSVNLASKYESKINKKWTMESFVAGKVSADYNFIGVKSISIYTPLTVDLSDYSRTATSNRFGTPVELQDEVQELSLSQDKSFSITIDKGNNEDQMNIKGAGEMLDLQMKEKMVPFIDKYAIRIWAQKAGSVVAVTALSTSNIVTTLDTGLTALDNNLVPTDNRWIFLKASHYSKLRLSSEVLASDPLLEKSFGRGIVGQFMNANIIKVPDSYFPTGLEFLIVHKDSALLPMKFKTLRILNDVAGIDGNVLEGRQYFDAFIKGAKAYGAYAGVLAAQKSVAVTITPTGASHALTGSGATQIWYTTDGTDPRYSKTRALYASAVTLTDGQTIKAYSITTDKFDGDVASATYTA